MIPTGPTGTTEIWTHVSHDALRPIVDLAQRVLHGTTTLISSFTAGARIVRASAGDDTRLPASAFCQRVLSDGMPFASSDGPAPDLDAASALVSYLGVPLRLTDGRLIGTLCVADIPSRRWSDDDRLLAVALSAHLLATIEQTIKIVAAPPPTTIGVEPTTVEASVSNGEPAAGPSGRILLADDLDLNRRLIADMLAIEGHVVDCVADGAAAVTAASTKAYDLILMDMIMPGMDGIEATRAIRALPAPAGTVPIVALTANAFSDQLDSCIAAGMNAALTKPMSLDALIQAVETWLRGRVRSTPDAIEPL